MASRRTIDWTGALDLEQAAANVATDIRGDWYRDPWGWPEVSWALKRAPKTFVDRLDAEGVARCCPVDVPKENFALRPAVVMDPIDRICYQALVDRLSPLLIGDQPDWVYGWRLPPGEAARGRYARNDYQWDNFRAHLSLLVDWFDVGLKTDVVSCFSSIETDLVADLIADRTGIGRVQDRLIDMLNGWAHMPTRSGLPQRSKASAVLANAFLRPIDDVLKHHGAIDLRFGDVDLLPQGAACRWMDDVWLFGTDAGDLRRAQIDLQRELESLRLRMNFAKTEVVEGEELLREVRQIEHSAVDDGLHALGKPADEGPLNDLVDRLVASPEKASRTTLRFACSRMRQHEKFGRVGDLVDHAARMPQGADHLSRLFRDSEAWRELDGWYLDYTRGPWATIDWAAAQLGTMFPSGHAVVSVAEYFGEELSTGANSLTGTTVAAQRLAAWDSDAARNAIRAAVSTSDNPLVRRSLALSGLAAGEGRTFARGVLRELSENRVTLDMLEDRNFQPVTLVDDFAAA